MLNTKENYCALEKTDGGRKIGVCNALFADDCSHFSLDGVDHLGRKILICDGHFNEDRKSHSVMCYGEAFREKLAEEKLEEL